MNEEEKANSIMLKIQALGISKKQCVELALILAEEVEGALYNGNQYDKACDCMEWTIDDSWYESEFKTYWGNVKKILEKNNSGF